MQATLEQPQQLHELNGIRYIASKLTMVSIFPLRCVAYRNFGPSMSGAVNHQYVLPAAIKGGYSKLDIYDAFERAPDYNQMTVLGKPVFSPTPVPCRNIASDLYKEWVENRLGCGNGLRPGIMVIDRDEPTSAEIKALIPQQEAYAKGLYHDAQGMADKHQWREITDLHREMAKWLGLKAKWIEDMESGKQETVKCSECRQEIPADARICFICKSSQKAA